MTQALDTLRATAETGKKIVRLQLADALLDERRPQDFDPFEALYWPEQAAADGDARAVFRAGTMWGTGLGCTAPGNRAGPIRGRGGRRRL